MAEYLRQASPFLARNTVGNRGFEHMAKNTVVNRDSEHMARNTVGNHWVC